MGKNVNRPAGIYDLDTYRAAGIDPRTGLPLKVAGESKAFLKEGIRGLLDVVDRQNAINRFTWYNLPEGLTGQLIERVLYYKYWGAFLYIEQMKKFYFLPFSLDGSIDLYGRFTGIRPLPFSGASQDIPKDQEQLAVWLNTQVKKPQYDIIMPEELKLSDLTDSCVILRDYSEGIAQMQTPRSMIQMPLLDVMSECIPFMRTALINNTGVSGMRVGSEDESSNVAVAANSVEKAALNGQKWIPITGSLDFQDLGNGGVAKSEEFLLAMQSLDNLRLSLYGLQNAGLFQKKSHMLESEQEMNGGVTGLIMQDGLTLRQQFCNIVNSIWGLGIWVEVSENVTGIDKNMDGAIQDDFDQSGTADNAPQQVGGTENVDDGQ